MSKTFLRNSSLLGDCLTAWHQDRSNINHRAYQFGTPPPPYLFFEQQTRRADFVTYLWPQTLTRQKVCRFGIQPSIRRRPSLPQRRRKRDGS